MPLPYVETPAKCCVLPFWVTSQSNLSPGLIARTIVVLSTGRAVQLPSIVAPWGGVVSSGAAEGSCRLAAGACVLRRLIELFDQLGRERVGWLERRDLFEHAHGRVGETLGQVLVREHKPVRWRPAAGLCM